MKQKVNSGTGQVPDMTSSFMDDLFCDPILPSQFFSEPMATRGQPEKRLMLAVLTEAVETFEKCFAGKTQRERRLLEEVEEWLYSADTVWPFSFVNISSALGINPDYLRSRLELYKRLGEIEKGNVSSGQARETIQEAKNKAISRIVSKQGRAA